MNLPATKVIVFNAAAVMIALAAVGAVARSLIFVPSAQPCSERYTSSTSLALERAGVVLTAADLQSGLGGRDAGVIDNLSIARLEDAPAPVAMTVRLPKGAASPHEQPRGGMSFPWQVRVLQGRSAACLSYAVHLPADFQFGRGGTLPGLTGSAAGEGSPESFAARIAWRDGGKGGSTLRLVSATGARSRSADREGFAFPRGRWVKIEQEVVLNTPKRADGALRVWVDGTLAVDRTDVEFRANPAVTFSGVGADVFYGTEDTPSPAPKDTKVSLTPFEVRW